GHVRTDCPQQRRRRLADGNALDLEVGLVAAVVVPGQVDLGGGEVRDAQVGGGVRGHVRGGDEERVAVAREERAGEGAHAVAVGGVRLYQVIGEGGDVRSHG